MNNIMTRVEIFHTCSIGQRQEGCWGRVLTVTAGWSQHCCLPVVNSGSDKHFNTHNNGADKNESK